MKYGNENMPTYSQLENLKDLMQNRMDETGNIKTRKEELESEIESINAQIQKAIEAENKARKDQTWLKKRLKVAKDELNDISNA